MTTEFVQCTKIQVAASRDSMRYASDCIEVCPRGNNDGVWLAATDASTEFVVVAAEGQVDEPLVLVPAEVLSNGVKRANPRIKLEGEEWRSSAGKSSKARTGERFPKLETELPRVNTVDHFALSLNVHKLLAIVEAIGSDGKVTIFAELPKQQTGKKTPPLPSVESKLCVVDADSDVDAVGVLMPCRVEGDAAFEKYNALSQEYVGDRVKWR